MFVSDRDARFINAIQEELMGNYRLQEIEYITIDNVAQTNDPYDNIYNEIKKTEMIYSDPIVIEAYVHHMPVQASADIYGTKFVRSIIVLIHKDYETENGIDIQLGQGFRGDDHMYQILKREGDDKQIGGSPNRQVFHQYLAVLR